MINIDSLCILVKAQANDDASNKQLFGRRISFKKGLNLVVGDVNVLFSALTRTSISSTFVASNLKFQDHAKERSELSGGVRPLPTLQ